MGPGGVSMSPEGDFTRPLGSCASALSPLSKEIPSHVGVKLLVVYLRPLLLALSLGTDAKSGTILLAPAAFI